MIKITHDFIPIKIENNSFSLFYPNDNLLNSKFYLSTEKDDFDFIIIDSKGNIITTELSKKYGFIDKSLNLFILFNFVPYMITFCKNKDRLNIYYQNIQIFNDRLLKFDAVNTIDDKDYFLKLIDNCLRNNIITTNFIQKTIIYNEKHDKYFLPGKLGVLLSHTTLCSKFNYNFFGTSDWLLVLEDDVKINSSANINIIITRIIRLVNQKISKSRYIKLFIHPEQYDKQFKDTNQIYRNIYKIIDKQWSNVAYLIHRDAINYLSKYMFPIDTYFDLHLSNFYTEINAVAYKNNIFDTCGVLNGEKDSDNRLNSLIFNHSL